MNTERQRPRRRVYDVGVAVLFFVVGTFGSWILSGQVHPALFLWDIDLFFDSDIPRILADMTNRLGSQQDTHVHPLFPLISLPLVETAKLLGLGPNDAVRAVIAVVAGVWSASIYTLLRSIGHYVLDAALFSAMALTSAAAIFWFSVPETYGLGSLSLVMALLVAAAAQRVPVCPAAYVTASVFSLSITVTNGMAGIALAFVNLPWRRAVWLGFYTFAIVATLWLVQKMFVPNAATLLDIRGVFAWVLPQESGGPLRVLSAFFSHSMVMPEVQIAHQGPPHTSTVQFSVQNSLPGSGGVVGAVAVGLWLMLLSLGIWGFLKSGGGRFRAVLGLVLAGQVLLHIVFGEETFLYSLHFVPLLVVVASFAVQTRFRKIALVLAAVFVLLAGINNWDQFDSTVSHFFKTGIAKERAEVLKEMALRPADPWPRGREHVVLATPGSSLDRKAYHELGGSFSPAPQSFGISIWIMQAGKILTTSDGISSEEIRQSFDWGVTDSGGAPAIVTETPYYRARWVNVGGSWVLELERGERTGRLVVALRSVGPAGGQVNELNWDGRRLIVNDRWLVQPSSPPGDVFVGEEGTAGWTSDTSSNTSWGGSSGWGYARIDLGQGSRWTIGVTDRNGTPAKIDSIQAWHRPTLKLPDPRFSESLNAQIAHLEMGRVGHETRAVDPLVSPVQSTNASAYVVAALARAGQIATAKRLSSELAENDFLGGFGAEADAPGLAIWALREVVSAAPDRVLEQSLWPHVRRKAEAIEQILHTKKPVHAKPGTAVFPYIETRLDPSRLAEPARNGLAVGRIGWEYPQLYVNAIMYRGLKDAAWFAQRQSHAELSRKWLSVASTIERSGRRSSC